MSEIKNLEARNSFFKRIYADRMALGIDKAYVSVERFLVRALHQAAGRATMLGEYEILRKEKPKVEDMATYLLAQGLEIELLFNKVNFFLFNDEYPDVPVIWGYYDKAQYEVIVVGEVSEVKKFLEKTKADWPGTHARVRVARSITAQGHLTVTTQLASKHKVAMESFFPFLGMPIEKYLKAYMESTAPVLILLGPPGTGKTTFLRTMIVQHDLKTLLSYNKDVIESPHFYSYARDFDFQLLALEDADNFIGARKHGNDDMATMLNDTQGVGDASDLKIVISTNLETLNRVEPALLRAGRCFGTINFRELSLEEVQAVWRDMKMEPHALGDGRKTWTLSEALNPVLITDTEHVPKTQRIGFMPG